MSELPRPVVDAIRRRGLTVDHPLACHTYSVELVQALLDARVLVLMDDHMEVVEDRNEWAAGAKAVWLREALEALTEAFADLLRHHTRAIWALSGELDYPEEERAATGRRAMTALSAARAALDATEPTT